MSYDEDYAEHDYGEVQFDESQEFNGQGYGNLDDDSYGGDDDECNSNYQHHGITNGYHETMNGREDDEDDGARWPHVDKTNADLEMLIEHVLSQAGAAGLNIDSDSDEDDSGGHDDYERDAEDDKDYGVNEVGEMGNNQNGEGNEGSGEDEMW